MTAPAPKRKSHGDRILDVLADGEFHTSAELYRRVPSIVHSRIAALRRQGYVILHQGGGSGAENHSYCWVRSNEEAA